MSSPSASTVLVTGAASGIGFAIAKALMLAGQQVIALDQDSDSLGELDKISSGKVHCEKADVSEAKSVSDAIDRGVAKLGPIRGVVNSAGTGADVPAQETTVDLFKHILDVNLLGSFLVAQQCIARMETPGDVSIINISSVSGILGSKGRAAYSASKGGIDALTRTLAVEWALLGVRVNSIAPGPIDTPLARFVHTANVRRQWTERVPLERYGTPDDVAKLALFLLDGSRSGYITGQTICVDGGFSVAGLRPQMEASS